MAGFFSNGSCQCQTSLFYLVSDIYELDTNGLGKCLGQGFDHIAMVCGGREPHGSVESQNCWALEDMDSKLLLVC